MPTARSVFLEVRALTRGTHLFVRARHRPLLSGSAVIWGAAALPRKGTTLKKISYSLMAVAIAVAGVALPATSASATDRGGWSEETGAFVGQPNRLHGSSVTINSTPKHTGKAERQDFNGTTHRRAHGWTTWAGVYHYTTARQECDSNVLATSGRQWGTSGTEAISPWVAFDPYAPCSGFGSSRTYYGN